MYLRVRPGVDAGAPHRLGVAGTCSPRQTSPRSYPSSPCVGRKALDSYPLRVDLVVAFPDAGESERGRDCTGPERPSPVLPVPRPGLSSVHFKGENRPPALAWCLPRATSALSKVPISSQVRFLQVACRSPESAVEPASESETIEPDLRDPGRGEIHEAALVAFLRSQELHCSAAGQAPARAHRSAPRVARSSASISSVTRPRLRLRATPRITSATSRTSPTRATSPQRT